MSEFMNIMQQRGFIKDANFTLDETPEQIVAYIGFDLTAPSLHVGSLIQLMVLRWLKKCGHDATALLGDATTKIGDPSGKDESRKMLSPEAIAENRAGIKSVIEQIIPDIDFASNSDWFDGTFDITNFLIEYGQHFTINRMLNFESVKRRLNRNQPLTFLEFCYMIYQAVDFHKLNEYSDCNMQIGGSDQWGNILNGVEVIRRKENKRAFAFTTPLLLDRDGNKMGKSQGKPIWLDAEMTPVYDFFQYWRNCDDTDVRRNFLMFTEFHPDTISAVMDDPTGGTNINDVKKLLAFEITKIVHGEEAAKLAQEQAIAIHERKDNTAVAGLITATARASLVDIMIQAGMADSRAAAKRLISGNGVSLDGQKITDEKALVETDSVLKVGKKPPVQINVEK